MPCFNDGIKLYQEDMKTKRKFVTPRVTQMVELCPEIDILGNSLENTARIISMGQEVKNYDFSDPDSGYTVDYFE